LLSIFDLIEEGIISSNLIELSPDLAEVFTLYCSKVLTPGLKGNLAMPYYHLKGEGFWHLIPRPGMAEAVNQAGGNSGAGRLQNIFLGAKFDEELYTFICLKETRATLRKVLIETYFSPSVQLQLVQLSHINKAAFEYSLDLLNKPRQPHKINESPEPAADYIKQDRDQGFRRAIVKAYDHRCAICGIRVITADGHTAVAAAHIIPWNISHLDDPTNGMALCHLCHWSFDEGITGVTGTYSVMASPQLKQGNNAPGFILTMEGRPIIKPEAQNLWPDLEALKWHRTNTFRRLK
jgi:putative restriction endonuclease